MMRAGRGALVILALFLASSGALRLGDGLGRAFANGRQDSPAPAEAAACDPPPAALAQELLARENEVRASSRALDDRKAALSLAEAAIARRLAELEAAETRLREVLAIADGAAEGDLKRLTAVYEAMKPADAAALFETMSPDFAAGFLARMQPASAAAILSGMGREKAYAVSALIAGRNARAPKD
jgi:flagellar motility protein MotE (MotC chaperone)